MDQELFRAVFAALPTTVSVITALGEAGVPCGLTTNTVCAVSAQPPLLLVCIDRRSRTLPALVGAGVFVVNFMAAHAEHVSRIFAGKSDQKFDRLRTIPADRAAGAPVLVGNVTAHAECVIQESWEAGDHLVLLGRIEHAAVYGHAPLMYYRRDYAFWPPERGDPRLGLVVGQATGDG